MNQTIQNAIEALKQNKAIVVRCDFFGWNDKFAERRHNNNSQYGYFYIGKKFVLCCHGGEGHNVQIRMERGKGTLLHSLDQIVKKFKPLLKGEKKLYIDCCYGASKACTIDGIQIVPLNASSHVTSGLGWYCDSLADFVSWYKNVVKTFRIKNLRIAISQPLTEEEDFDNHNILMLEALHNGELL